MSSPHELRSQLSFHPEWFFDPVPWAVLQILDRATLLDLARVQLEARKSILAAQTKAIDEAQGILKRVAGTKG